MKRLTICAFGAFVFSISTSFAQDASKTAGTSYGVVQHPSELALFVPLGADKSALPCPEFCVPARVIRPADASVGERDVLTAALAYASNTKLHVEGGRTQLAGIEKYPSSVVVDPVSNAVTQNAFRPSLDPVLAQPITQTTE